MQYKTQQKKMRWRPMPIRALVGAGPRACPIIERRCRWIPRFHAMGRHGSGKGKEGSRSGRRSLRSASLQSRWHRVGGFACCASLIAGHSSRCSAILVSARPPPCHLDRSGEISAWTGIDRAN